MIRPGITGKADRSSGSSRARDGDERPKDDAGETHEKQEKAGHGEEDRREEGHEEGN